MKKWMIREVSAGRALATSAVAAALCGCSGEPDRLDNAPIDVQPSESIATVSSPLVVRDGYSAASATEYLEAEYGPRLDQCCNACSKAWVTQGERWDLAMGQHRRWREARRALRFRLFELGARVTFIATKEFFLSQVRAAILVGTLGKLPTLASRAGRLRLALGAAEEVLSQAIDAILDGDATAVEQLSIVTTALDGVLKESQAIALDAAEELGPRWAARVAAAAGALSTVVEGVLDGIEAIDTAVAESQQLLDASAAAKTDLSLAGQLYKAAVRELETCCTQQCNCTPTTGSLTPTPDVDEDCDGQMDNAATYLEWVTDSIPQVVVDNGCQFDVVGSVGESCSPGDCPSTFCWVDGSGNVTTICAGVGWGPGSFPGGSAVCQATTRYY